LAAYGRLPSDFDENTAMGLAMNIPMIEARQSMAVMQGINAAFGDGNAIEAIVHASTGNAALAFAARVKAQHQKAVSG
jgi:hypothetical protein